MHVAALLLRLLLLQATIGGQMGQAAAMGKALAMVAVAVAEQE